MIYDSKLYWGITAIALLMIIFGLLHIGNVKLGVEFKGGSLVIVDSQKDISVNDIKAALSAKGLTASVEKFKTPSGYRYEIEVSNPEYIFKMKNYKQDVESLVDAYAKATMKNDEKEMERIKAELEGKIKEVEELMDSLGIEYNATHDSVRDMQEEFYTLYQKSKEKLASDISSVVSSFFQTNNFSIQIVSPLLSLSFIDKALNIALYSAVLVVLFVFWVFRNPLPSVAVLTGALSDLIIALGGMGFFGIPLTLATFAALLMIVGYSLDTDTMLTIRAVKRKDGKLHERIEDAFYTGTTMSTTAILAFSVVFALALLLRIPLYYQISSVALIGLLGDLFATWGINAVMLLHFGGRHG